MKVKKESTKEIIEFDSLNEFYSYITTTEINKAFEHKSLHSIHGSEDFTGTKSFEEAVELFKNGWTEKAKELTQKLKVIENEVEVNTKQKPCLSMQGYQAVVPLYLHGVPNNMVNKKMVPVKQKVITINKPISYAARISKQQILEESIKALQVIKKIEAQGVRCNLNIVWAVSAGKTIIVKVRIKSSTEKLNISKLAFPLVNPSMLRRLAFRFLEVYPGVTEAFTWGYGTPVNTLDIKDELEDDSYYLPRFLKQEVNSINDLENVILN